MFTDPIADFLTRLRNAGSARRSYATVRASRMIKAIADVLAARGFIESVEEIQSEDAKNKELKINLKGDREPLELKRVSKPGQRIYIGHEDIKRVKSGLGLAVLSTSLGIISGEEAKKKKVGGEYLCEIF